MWWENLLVRISLIVFLFSGGWAIADCPSADLTGDCFVDFEDFALMANQWLTTDPCVPNDMVYIPDGEFEMGDHLGEGGSDELPVHAVLLNPFFISKYETTNKQYCDYLNFAYDACDIKLNGGIVYASSDSSNSYPYCDTNSSSAYSQINYSSGVFSVRTKGGRDMSDDPMVQVSWYGAAAYCNWRSGQEGYQQLYDPCDPDWPCDFSKNGYRLPAEAEWEYAARGGLSGKRFPWFDPNITHSLANYYAAPSSYTYDVSPTSGHHPDYSDVVPYIDPVGSFLPNGYGLYDMAGNVLEWCNDWYDSSYYSTTPYPHVNPEGPASGTYRVFRGGCWNSNAVYCRVATRDFNPPVNRISHSGFRLVLDF